MRGGHTLIIAEKFDAAQRIASALSEGPPTKKTYRGIPYFEFKRNGRKYVVAPAMGHLYTVTQRAGDRSLYPVFEYTWAPRHLAERGAKKIKTIISAIEKLSRRASEFINATDYDVEGSLIGYMILKHACGGAEKKAKRMKFSTLTPEELNQAFERLMPSLDFEMAEAGRTRHEVDWLYGVNLSRALILSVEKQLKKHFTLSIGRVQGPTLKLLCEREYEINSFVPTPYWEIQAEAIIGGSRYRVEFERNRLPSLREAEAVVSACKGRTGTITSVVEKTSRRMPPEPFDLGSLQREAYRFFGYTPSRTLNIAERLYLNALISYPRTSSQKLPPTINYEAILKGLAENPSYRKLAEKVLEGGELKPVEGAREDPAHPAIYPTGKLPEAPLSKDDSRIYDLVVKRFLAAFGKPSIRLMVKVSMEVEGYKFTLNGRRIIEEGWISLYKPYAEFEEKPLPPLKQGEKVLLERVEYVQKFTEPPPRYNPASLLKAMEELELGTKATRAEIIETLYQRGYIRGERITVTDVGFTVVEAFSKYCPTIISVEFTRNLERQLYAIERGEESRENVLSEALEELKPVVEELKKAEENLGGTLSKAIQAENLRRRLVGSCPSCGTGSLVILRSRRTGKRFIGCTNFFTGKCRQAYPLPQRGRLTVSDKPCKLCGWPTLTLKLKGKRPFTFCINPECPSRRDKS
ncbi:MAG: DNA topoisomerase I [Candidatus Hecatellales archaeon]|nr:MAG: DNA topoisomerase I [Candidatus Hecatellales archaeon]